MNSPLICSFKPIKINKNLDESEIMDIKAGEEFSVIVSRNRLSDSFEVHTFGSNLKGQLGIG
jgi:alpha-tubulin suppressor-like RCC1 family protein